MSERSVEQVIEAHEASGKYITVDGVRTFVLDWGEGEPVFCIHGVPTSSYLYRKVLKELVRKGLRGVAIDLPGLGLSDRPEEFDYSFPNFAHFCAQAAKELGLEKYHLVIHDIGGPIGFALAAQNREKILSLTILNTWIDVDKFEKPLPMRPFEKPVLGEGQLAATTHTTWQLMFKGLGASNTDVIPTEEINAYVDLLKRVDGGKAFLKIMRNFEDSVAFRELCHQAVQDVPYPVQAVWGVEDPGLEYERYGEEIKQIANLKEVHKLPAKHFLQEDQWEAVAAHIAAIAGK
ncbi:alpha/beta hydrolase [Pontibacter diazotrophicus]|uniref:Alpha/beta hydrolase n=1 Tax=Pontibacter diazotrophicus TaxID=1400979 RepID=A0A3D8LGH3_9BACT|nr:alpha/beta hydrolase [Pontibacter diazotrophicus]RDV16559.1 alpha/beta hydrolase [Pontibacter diazotrophicus]